MDENTNEYSTKHPHEPEIPATYDDEGRCLICVLLVRVTQLEAENEELETNLSLAISMYEGEDSPMAKLEAELAEYRNLYHLGEAKITSREAIIGQLSETELAKDVTRLEAENEAYHELILEVANKYPGETRHETALRYIRERENQEQRVAMSRESE